MCTRFIGCSQNKTTSKNNPLEKPTIRLLLNDKLRVIDYAASDTYDTKIAFSKTHLVLMNFDLGHADFYATSAKLTIFKNGTMSSHQTIDLDGRSTQLGQLVDSLTLTQTVVSQWVLRKNDPLSSNEMSLLGIKSSDLKPENTKYVASGCHQVKKSNNLILHLSYSKTGVTTLTVVSGTKIIRETLSKEVLPDSPFMTLMDITGDGKKELFVFYPDVDYWESKSYQMVIYDMSDF